MKNIFIFFIVLNLYTCKKDAISEVGGYYTASGKIVYCSYYYCDTTFINTVFWVQDFKNSDEIHMRYYDSTVNEFENLGGLKFEKMNAKEIVFSGHYISKLTIDKETNYLTYYRYINNKRKLEDTVSRYLIFEGYKR